MASTFFYLACLSALSFPLSYAYNTATVPILDWSFDFPGSAIFVVGENSGSTTYYLTCNKPGECQWTQVPTMASYLDNIVGILTFVEAGAPYNAAMTQSPITMQTTESEGRFTDVSIRPPNLVDCTSTSMGQEPTSTFELDGTTAVYKMVVITQGVEKLNLGTVTTGATPLVTTGGAYGSQDDSSDSSSSSSSSSTSTDAPPVSTQTPDSAAPNLVASSLMMTGLVLMTAFFV
ncbi:hypothetical protein QBC36DRAFT_295154 [Triangularia setosa]|uniref:Uncharacterized protein n=1 Tax=Triangularia setosa TaxID=2587417 RepID=A0AAN6VYB2_9PEZI|nr:hypothetical protein QBC36DRAFT_295154 [Podospora setosa]